MNNKLVEIDDSMIELLISSYPSAFAIYSLDSQSVKCIYYSEDIPALSGMTSDEYDYIIKNDAALIIEDNDRIKVKDILADVYKHPQMGKVINLAYRIIHKTSYFVWLKARIRVAGMYNGKPLLVVVFDIDAFGADENAVLLDNSAAMIYVIDRYTHELLYVNNYARELFGNKDYCGEKCFKYVRGIERECKNCCIVNAENGQYESECFFDKLNTWMNIKCHDIEWYGHDAVAVFGNDVTDDRNIREQLLLDKNTLDKIINNIPVGIGVCEIRGKDVKTIAVNNGLTKLLGMTGENFSVSDKSLMSRIHPSDMPKALEIMRKTREPGVILSCEYRIKDENNENYKWYRLTGRTIQENDHIMLFVSISDITKEKNNEMEIITSKRMYQTAVQTAKLTVWRYDIKNHRIIMAEDDFTSSEFKKLRIPSVIENVPESLIDYIDEKDFLKMKSFYARINAGEQYTSCEVWMKNRPDTEPRCQLLTYMTVFDADGKPDYAYGIGQNITSKKLEELDYNKIEIDLKNAYVDAVGSSRLNLTKNKCIEVNSPFASVIDRQKKYSADEFFVAVSEDIIDDVIKERYIRSINCKCLIEYYKNGGKTESFEYPVKFSNGEEHWLKANLSMYQNPNTGDVEAITYAKDITEEKRNKEIVEHLTGDKFDYIAILNLYDNTIEFRKKNQRISFGTLNVPEDYTKWRRYVRDVMLAPDDKEKYMNASDPTAIKVALKSDGSYSISINQEEGYRILRRQTQYSWLNEKKGEVLLVSSDITAAYRKEQESLEQLKEALEAAEIANRAKTEFVSRISHDIRTPISIISSMTDFAFEDIDDKEKLISDLGRIKTSNVFLLSLINDVLDISKIDSGKIELNPTPYSVEEYIKNVRNMLDPLCDRKNINSSIDSNVHNMTVFVDQVRLNQITFNLLSNAVKYTPENGEVGFSIKAITDGDMINIRFTVKDNGIGMSDGFIKKMYEPFTQEYSNPDRPKTVSGTGLGLSIVKKITDLMGGSIEVSSRIGCGTSITVNLTLPLVDNADEEVEDENDEHVTNRKLKGTVLLAEDNDMNTAIAVRILSNYGLDVVTAENGKKALELFENSETGYFKAILMDIQMPEMNGYDACEAIRSLKRIDALHVPIIAMTADAFSEAMEKCYQVGMNDYVTKPIDPKALRDVLVSAFKRKRK